MQSIHDLFAGMTVQTSDDANRTQEHPAVRMHAETARPALFVNAQYTIGLAGLLPARVDAPARLPVRSTRPNTPTRAGGNGQPGDVAFWDNRCVQHMVMGDVTGHRRYMHRTTVAGEAPIAPAQ